MNSTCGLVCRTTVNWIKVEFAWGFFFTRNATIPYLFHSHDLWAKRTVSMGFLIALDFKPVHTCCNYFFSWFFKVTKIGWPTPSFFLQAGLCSPAAAFLSPASAQWGGMLLLFYSHDFVPFTKIHRVAHQKYSPMRSQKMLEFLHILITNFNNNQVAELHFCGFPHRKSPILRISDTEYNWSYFQANLRRIVFPGKGGGRDF